MRALRGTLLGAFAALVEALGQQAQQRVVDHDAHQLEARRTAQVELVAAPDHHRSGVEPLAREARLALLPAGQREAAALRIHLAVLAQRAVGGLAHQPQARQLHMVEKAREAAAREHVALQVPAALAAGIGVDVVRGQGPALDGKAGGGGGLAVHGGYPRDGDPLDRSKLQTRLFR
ncbi:hypothetical protein ACEN8K_18875 [Variovorax sp. CT11-76]